MKTILKILLIPIVIAMTVFVWLCAGILYLSAWVFGIAGTLLGFLAIVVLITSSVKDGIILLVIASLASPMGLPRAAAGLLGVVQQCSCNIRGKIYTK